MNTAAFHSASAPYQFSSPDRAARALLVAPRQLLAGGEALLRVAAESEPNEVSSGSPSCAQVTVR